jgi:hypothetical protein
MKIMKIKKLPKYMKTKTNYGKKNLNSIINTKHEKQNIYMLNKR